MNIIMKYIDYWDRKVKKWGIFELTMAQGATMGFTLIILKIFPQILALSVWWFIALWVVCGGPVAYALWFKKNGHSDASADGDHRPSRLT
jgi:hypothetical protein